MRRTISLPLMMILLGGLFFALVILNNQLLSSVRTDLTENKVYSLSKGSEAILSELDEPINLYFFFSEKSSKGMTSLRNYANRVQSLLEEYQSRGNGKIRLNIIDPEPFSEAEDLANQYGLTAAGLGVAGDSIYLGLAATNALDDQQIIAFFDPQQESFLEYEISKLIYQLSNPAALKVTLVTDLPVTGGQNPMTGRFDPAWTFYDQLDQLYSLTHIDSTATTLPEETDVLMLVHPKGLSESLTYAIDQYVMAGGNVMAFVDPHSESDAMSMMGGMSANSSELSTLLDSWGVVFDPTQVVLDASLGLDIRTPQGGVARHFGFIGLTAEQLDRNDVTTANLEMINAASVGVLSKKADADVQWTPLMTSSQDTDVISADTYASARDPQTLSQSFNRQDKAYTLAARISGTLRSAYDSKPENTQVSGAHVSETSAANIVVVADSDLLADRFWVQQTSFFGQTIVTPFANNGDLVTNSVDNLGGSNALISVRSRGTFARPFKVVEDLTVKAEESFRAQERALQQQLEETEAQLAQLQGQQMDGGALALSPEQQKAVDDFMQKKIDIRKALRDVRHQLDKDIESLGNWLKFINIAAAPLALMLVLMVLARLFRRNARLQKGGA
ncbi:Gldg family protein [Aestuariibacter halophilus]|uniref:Gldg family protein n=1 Tax=Fluctibacter halophilus TaxID=226011 RepID=A0ABS8GC93_9ALTE|nr:Gldg family protein [Aestuariibacter halophilus]MCC2618190.1 Gldg family protein [Aestuariibacter halophilus]